MKSLLLQRVGVVLCLLFPVVNGEDPAKSASMSSYTRRWDDDDFRKVASRYYKSLEDKDLEKTVATLNDLSEIIIEPTVDATTLIQIARTTFIRWGRKPCSITNLYRAVEQGDSKFKRDFQEIFGKKLKHYKVVCISYNIKETENENTNRGADYSQMLAAEVHSLIDLWLMDEDGKCYVVLSYEPASGFKGNMRPKALEKLGIHGAKLWEE